MKIFLLGSIAWDEIGRFKGRFSDVIRPEMMEKLTVSFVVEESQKHLGGCLGNMAFGLGLLDQSASVCGVIGTDGEAYREALGSWGMDLNGLIICAGQTAKAVITTDLEGAQIAHFYPGVIGTGSSTLKLPESAKEGDIFLVGPENHDRMLKAIRDGSERKMRIFFDPGQLIHTFSKAELLEVLDVIETMICNEYEWALFMDKIQMSEDALMKKISLIIVTEGAAGLRWSEDGIWRRRPAFPAKTQDPTGAGDALRAGFLAGLKRGYSIDHSLSVGLVLASASVEHPLAQGYSFSPNQVNALRKLGFD